MKILPTRRPVIFGYKMSINPVIKKWFPREKIPFTRELQVKQLKNVKNKQSNASCIRWGYKLI